MICCLNKWSDIEIAIENIDVEDLEDESGANRIDRVTCCEVGENYGK